MVDASSAAALSCHSCGAPISTAEIGEGLAVRVDGKLVCPLCVDTLPGTAQVKINQVRALRGLDVTTYRVPRPKFKSLHCYTFTTTTQLNHHRRVLTSTGTFNAPLIPIDHKPVPKVAAATRKAPSTGQPPWMVFGLAAAGVVVIGAIIGLTVGGSSKATTTRASSGTVAMKQRSDYASSASMAWAEAARDPACPSEVLTSIAKEYEAELNTQLTAVESTLTDGDLSGATVNNARVHIPDDIRFRSLTNRQKTLADRIAQAKIAATKTQTAPVGKAPIIATKPTVPTDGHVEPTGSNTPSDAPPTGPVYIMNGVSFNERLGQYNLHDLGDGSRKLLTTPGSMSAAFALEPGSYQCYVDVTVGSEADLEMGVVVDGQKSAVLRLAKNTASGWKQIEIPGLVIENDEPMVQITLVKGQGAIIHRLLLLADSALTPRIALTSGLAMSVLPVKKPADSATPEVPADTPDGTPPGVPSDVAAQPTDGTAANGTAANGTVPAVVAPAAPTPNPDAIILSASAFTAGIAWDPLELPTAKEARSDTRQDSEYTYPADAQPLFQSDGNYKTRQHIQLSFPQPLANGSGIMSVIHSRRSERNSLIAHFSNMGGQVISTPVSFQADIWTTLTVQTPGTGGPWVSVKWEDEAPLTTGFVIGRSVIIPGQPAQSIDLGVRPRSLQTPTYRELLDLVHKCGVRRKSKDTIGWCRVDKLKVLVTSSVTSNNWPTVLRAGLKVTFDKAWGGKSTPDKTVQSTTIDVDWIKSTFAEKDPKKAVVHPDSYHVVVLISAGSELPDGGNIDDVIDAVWMPFFENCLSRGIIPIPAFGPSNQQPQRAAEVNRLWVALQERLDKMSMGIPILDLRSVQAVDGDVMQESTGIYTANLVTDALGELTERVLRLQKAGK